MTKITIELRRDKNHPVGYGSMSLLQADHQEVVDAVLDWTQEPANIGRKVYRHYVRHAQEKAGELGEYDFTKGGWNQAFDRGHGIMRCHLVTYLDIYWQ